jgi:Fumarylacetoacetate (FAA) hydrolase family
VPTFTFRDRDRILTRLDFSTLPTPYPFALTLQRYRTEKILTERPQRQSGPGSLHPLELSTRVNGVYKQRATTDTMIYSIPTLLEFLTRTVTLQPGDLMSTGTAGGTGVGRTPQEFLHPGDTVIVGTTGIGYLRNPVVAGWPKQMRSTSPD